MRKKHKVSYIHDHDIMTAARQSDRPAVIEAVERLRAITLRTHGNKLSEKWTDAERIKREAKEQRIIDHKLVMEQKEIFEARAAIRREAEHMKKIMRGIYCV